MTWRRNPLVTTLIWIIVNGSLSGQTLECHPAENLVKKFCCPMCPAGHRVKEDCTESCLSCVEQTYLKRQYGLKKCFTCKICDSESGLTMKMPCTLISDTVCEPLDGFRCIDFKDGSCAAAEKRKRCAPGQYFSEKDGGCSPCPNGTFSNGTAPSCQQHTQCEDLKLQQIKPGTASADTDCGNPATRALVTSVICITLLIIVLVPIIIMYKRHSLKVRNMLPVNCLKKDQLPVEESISMHPQSSDRGNGRQKQAL